MNRIYFLIFTWPLCVAAISKAQPSITMPEEGRIEALMNEFHIPVVGVSVIEDGSLKQATVFGTLPNHSRAPENTLFNIASLTKPLTSTMVLMLVSQQKWQLDEPLYHYWIDPDVANDERHKKLTTRHILSHQSGLPNWRGHEPGGKISFAFAPGAQWKYSGEGFEYLRQALERKFSMPFEKLVDSLLFRPLKMADTRFFWDSSVDSTLYANRFHENGTAFPMETWDTANPSNLALTTVADYAKFCIAVMDRFGISPRVYEEMISSQVNLQNNKSQGLGWVRVKNLSNREYALVHSGSNPGINTIVILLPRSRRGIVVFTNGTSGDQLYKKLVAESFDLGDEIIDRLK